MENVIKPKQYTNQTVIGQKGINLIECVVLEMGYIWNSTNLEAGIDGTIEIRNSETFEASNFIIQVQSKATERKFSNETDETFEYVCNERDIEYWLKGNCPVILICVNVINRTSYWISIKDYFKDLNKRKSKKIIFDKRKNLFDVSAKEALASLAIPDNSGFYLSPPPITEQIFSNLLKVTNLPERIYLAQTEFRDFKSVWDRLVTVQYKPSINKSFILHEGKIYSFNDLSKLPWSELVNRQTVESFETNKWSLSNNIIEKNLCVKLLNNTLESYLFNKKIIKKKFSDTVLYYFLPELDEKKLPKSRTVGYNRLGRKSSQSVCERYFRKSDPSKISYFRHLAFEGQFLRYSNQWYIEITPTYYFTHDGFKIHTYYESKLKGKKGLDKAEIVFSETLFWAYVISLGKDDLFSNDFLSFGKLYSENLDVGINDEVWLNKEDEVKQNILKKDHYILFENEN